MLLCVPAKAADYSGFYKWSDYIVVKVDEGGIMNDVQTIIIRVKSEWNHPQTPPPFYGWLPVYTLCKDAARIEAAKRFGLKGWHVHVILADPEAVIRVRTSAWMPLGDRCEETLQNIEDAIRKGR
jgi:hypothetical protein